MERFDRLKESFYKALNDQNYKEAKDIIDDFGPKNEVESRVKLHYEGRYLAALGLYSDAIEQMKLTQSRFGSNIQITKDLAWLYRQLGDERLWIEATNKLTDDFNSVQKNLSFESRFETLMQLFNERMDQGFISIAKKIFERIEKEEMNETHKKVIQKTRVRIQLLMNDVDTNLNPETYENDVYLSTLMSCYTDSTNASIENLRAALASIDLTTHQKSHLFYDFIDILLVRGIIPDTLFKKIGKSTTPKPVSYFELNVKSLVYSLMEPKPIYWFKFISSPQKISLFDELRILTLQRRYGNDRVQIFADFQINMRLEKLDVESQVLWSKRLKPTGQ